MDHAFFICMDFSMRKIRFSRFLDLGTKLNALSRLSFQIKDVLTN